MKVVLKSRSWRAETLQEKDAKEVLEAIEILMTKFPFLHVKKFKIRPPEKETECDITLTINDTEINFKVGETEITHVIVGLPNKFSLMESVAMALAFGHRDTKAIVAYIERHLRDYTQYNI